MTDTQLIRLITIVRTLKPTQIFLYGYALMTIFSSDWTLIHQRL